MKKQIHILEGLIIIIILIIALLMSIKFIYNIKHETLDTSYMWNIEFNNLKIIEGSEEGNLSLKDNQINLEANLKNEGEYISFTIDITNHGSLDAKINDINLKVDNPTNILTYSISYINKEPINIDDILLGKETKTILITIKYPKQPKKIYDPLNLKLAINISYTAIY